MAKRQHISEDNYLSGLKEVIENLQEAVDKIEHGSAKGLADALLFVGSESQQLAPVDTGDLRGSLLVEMDGKEIHSVGDAPENAKMGSVGYTAKYAADQHEHTEYDHPKGGQAKYLESVLVGNQDRILHLIAGGIMDELGE